MYDYTICSEAYEAIFHVQCTALEKHIPGLKEVHLWEDVDGSKIRVYQKNGAKLTAYNDYTVGAVYIRSEFDLKRYFPNAKKSPFANE